MTDLLTLERLADQSRRDTNLTKFAREEYRKFIDRKKTLPEDGFEIKLPDSIDIGQENALRLLEQHGYIKTYSQRWEPPQPPVASPEPPMVFFVLFGLLFLFFAVRQRILPRFYCFPFQGYFMKKNLTVYPYFSKKIRFSICCCLLFLPVLPYNTTALALFSYQHRPMTTNRFLQHLETFEQQLRNGNADFEKISKLIFTLQDAETQEKVDANRKDVLPKLVPFFYLLLQTVAKCQKDDSNFREDDIHDADMGILKMFSMYGFAPGIEVIADMMQKDYRNMEYMWSVILGEHLFTTSKDIIPIVSKLNGYIPCEFLGVVYLDICNAVARNDETFRPHPFATSEGIKRLEKYFQDGTEHDESYLISATLALPYLPKEFSKKYLPLSLNHSDFLVKMEGLFAGVLMNIPECKTELIALAKDVRTSWKAAKYLEDLGLAAEIPSETQAPDFKALTELASWLAYPTEYGTIPDELTIVDCRELYWRPLQDRRTIYIIRYTYRDYGEEKKTETNVGIAGLTPDGIVDSQLTFCHWVDELNKLSPEEIYAVYCAGAGELQLENWKDPQVGLAILREDNPGFAVNF